MAGILPTQLQELAFGLIKLHRAYTGPLLKPVKLLDGITSLQQLNSKFGVINKLSEGAFNHTDDTENRDAK